MPFQDACDARDLPPGARRVVRLGDVEMILWNVAGSIHATARHCPHQGFPLDGASIRGTVATCGLHGLEFDVAAGHCLSPEALRLRRFPVAIREGRILVDPEGSLPARPETPAGADQGPAVPPPDPPNSSSTATPK